MSLIKCEECGGQVSDKAERCPHCGYPVMPEPTQELLINYPEQELPQNNASFGVKQQITRDHAITDDDLRRAAIGPKADYYIESPGGGNVAAFFFTIPWLAYRKMYAWIAVYIFVSVSGGVIGFFIDKKYGAQGFCFLISLTIAFVANKFYLSNIDNKINNVKRLVSDPKEQIAILERNGGVNTPLCVLMLIICAILFFVIATATEVFEKSIIY